MAATRTPKTTRSRRPEYSAPIAASYDIARNTTENAAMWQFVDSLSAAEANSPAVRKIVRNRARYETANNSYADGMMDTLSYDTVGSAVQLQLGDTDKAQKIEKDFAAWAHEIKLWQKVRLMRRAKAVDGEVFAKLITNPKLRSRVKLDVKLLECEMVESWLPAIQSNELDGIRYDEAGNPVAYRILRSHPGDGWRADVLSKAGDWTDSKFVIHYFSATRPGQVRGVSELLPSLSLFGELRKYTKAVISAATRAAEISGVLETNLLPDDEAAASLSSPISIEIPRNSFLSMPDGWTAKQMKAEQPTSTYPQFKSEIINEMARGQSMPFNVAACNSSGYNYASGRLDHQTYDRSLEIERADLSADVLDRIYAAWLDEYSTVTGMNVTEIEQAQDHEWHFGGRDHVDPNKEANADETRLQNGTLTRARYWAKRGADWKRETQQWIEERVQMEDDWNKSRKRAGLEPAPLPSNAGQQMVIQPAKPEEGED